MPYTPNYEDTMAFLNDNKPKYIPNLEDSVPVLGKITNQAVSTQSSQPSITTIQNRKPLSSYSLSDLLSGINKSIGESMGEENKANNAFYGGTIAGGTNTLQDIGARILGEKNNQNDYLSGFIKDFLKTHSSQYLPLEKQGEFLGNIAPTFAIPGGIGAGIAEKALPSFLNKGLLGNVLRGTAEGATANAIAEPLLNPNEDLTQATEHGAKTGGELGGILSSMLGVGKYISPVASRGVYSVFANPSRQEKISNKLYDKAINTPENQGAVIFPTQLKTYIQNRIEQESKLTNPESETVVNEFRKTLDKIPSRLSPEDAQQWVRAFRKKSGQAAKGDALSDNPANWPSLKLSSAYDELSNQMAADLINGIEKPRYINNKIAYEGNPTAANDYRNANKFYANRVIPAQHFPVSPIGLALQGVGAALGPATVGEIGSLGTLGALFSPTIAHWPNPAANVAKRFLGKAALREINQKTPSTDYLQQQLTRLVPGLLNSKRSMQ